jgi:23S rRNA (adenine-N6)-dimethyltransferase
VSGNGTRRQWGWHPLRPDWAARIVEDADVRPGELVLDLGAGYGALTDHLVAAGARVVAVELHPGRADRLRRKYAGDKRVRVVRADLRALRLPREPFRVVASPPYALTTEVVTQLLGSDRLRGADLVLQRAAARRLASDRPRGRHGRAYRLDVVRNVPRSAFDPAPQVDSSVLRVRRR